MSGFNGGRGDANDYTYGGYGYTLDRIIIVDKIDNIERPIIWGNDNLGGVYYNALEYVLI